MQLFSVRPVGPPTLVGADHSYQLGSILNVTCSSQPGHPPPTLTWSINRRKVKATAFHTIQMQDRLTVSTSVLVLQLSSPNLPSEVLVKCSAKIGQFYSQQTATKIHLVKPDRPRMGEPLLSGTRGTRLPFWVVLIIFAESVKDTWWYWFSIDLKKVKVLKWCWWEKFWWKCEREKVIHFLLSLDASQPVYIFYEPYIYTWCCT